MTKGKTKPSWLMTGNKALKAAESEKKRIERSQNRMFDFWLSAEDGKNTALITFLDGSLNSEGVLVPYSVWMHTVPRGERFEDFVCLKSISEDHACPICESGNRNFLVRLFTIIDHRKYKDKNGKMRKNSRRLFLAKQGTTKQLMQLASEYERLKGITFKVVRTGDKEPKVGSMFTVKKKWANMKEFAKYFKLKKEEVMPADYGSALNFVEEEELRAMGFGHGSHTSDYGSDDDDFDEDL